MIHTTAIWICPALCGCEIRMTANWATDPTEDTGRRVSYQHPRPFSITAMAIEHVCAAHDHLRTEPLSADPYGGRPGYIRLPLADPTEAQRLYIHLYAYSGQRYTPDTCRCRIYECVDRRDQTATIHQHPRHTSRCQHHQHDDAQHSAAHENAQRKARIIERLERALAVSAADIAWEFDDQRVLTVTVTGATPSMVVAAQTWANTNLGVGRVAVMAR